MKWGNLGKVLKTMADEGKQKMPLPNMSLWYKDYFEPKGLEKQQVQDNILNKSVRFSPVNLSSQRL